MRLHDRLHVRERTVRARPLFEDRTHAGRMLTEWIAPAEDPQALVLALPRGGIPVGRPLADAIGCVMHPILVRKLPIPVNPEMGFGAITVDGTVMLNEEVVDAFRLSESTIQAVAADTLGEVERRSEAYPGGLPLPPLEGRDVWLVDDGLATGFSAIAAARMISAHGVRRLRLAVPCAPRSSAELLSEHVNEAWCIIVQEGGPFAVASFYRRFQEMSDEEVVRLLD